MTGLAATRESRSFVAALVRMTALAIAELFHARVQLASQQRPQGCAVGVTHTSGDLVDAGVARLEEMNSALDAERLEVRQRRLAEDLLHVTGERPLAGADRLCCLVE